MKIKYKNIYFVKERDGKDLKYTLNSNKIRSRYEWSEKTNLEEGILDTIEWVKKNINYFKKASLNYKHKK
jgi:dTDP-glucose 4,6-dehydratase